MEHKLDEIKNIQRILDIYIVVIIIVTV